MSKIKDHKTTQNKILRVTPTVDKICFNFSSLTSNKHYNFSHLHGNDKIEAYDNLVNKLADLSAVDMMYTSQMGKKLGSEKIHYSQLNEPFQQICDHTNIVSRDSSMIVFQFCNHKYRLICKGDMNHSNIMHIIGFDFDFSAYDHG